MSRCRPTVLRALALVLCLSASHGVGAAAEVSFNLTDSKGGGPVGSAVVSLVPLDATIVVPPAASSGETVASIEQRAEQFVPLVTAVRAGATVSLPNNDKVDHHAYSKSPAKPFEFPLYKPGRAEKVVFDKPGIVTIGCNMHDSMIAYVVVLEVPWFAVTPAQGTAVLRDVPAGRYRATVWHPRLKTAMEQEIDVAAEPRPLKFALELKPAPRGRSILDGAKGGYR